MHLTDGIDEVVELAISKEGLRKLPKEHLQSACGDVDVLPLSVVQIDLLIW